MIIKKALLTLTSILVFSLALTSQANAKSEGKIIIANRPNGWLPQTKRLAKPTGKKPAPSAPLKLFSVKGAGGVALAAFGCGSCEGPQITIVNRTFEPITIYTQDKESFDQGKSNQAIAQAQPNETITLTLDNTGDWRIQIYGDSTAAWIFDSGFLFYPCRDQQSEESKVWQIVDPFGALEITNYTFDILIVFDGNKPAGVLFPLDIAQSYFTAGTHHVSILQGTWLKVIYEEDLNFLPNEVKKLDIVPPPPKK